jgi:hypothetical protein
MNRKPFDHIENMFREAAENFQPPVSPEAWDKMEQLLDKSGRKRRPVFWYWPLLLILITGAGGVFFFQDSAVKKQTNQQKESTLSQTNESRKISREQTNETSTPAVTRPVQTTKPDGTSVPEKGNMSDQPAIQDKLVSDKIAATNSVQPHQPSSVVNKTSNLPSKKPDEISQSGNRQITVKRQVKPTKRNANTLGRGAQRRADGDGPKTKIAGRDSQPGKEPVKKDADLSKQGGTPETPPALNIAANPETVEAKNAAADGTNKVIAGKADSSSTVKASSINDSSILNQNDVKEKKLTLKKVPTGFYYMVMLSGDGNGLKKFSTEHFAVGYGVAVGYQFHRRWSIQAGISGTDKKYDAGGKDYYYFRPGSYYDTVNMKSINADCYIVEIPISLRYNVIQKNKSSLYATAGLSSYIMKKEVYNYYYTYHNTWPAVTRKATHTYTDNKHYFSVVNLSLGYERKLWQSLSLQAEPYVKIPVSGVGEGKVHLYSAGMQLSFKWQRMKTIQVGSR